MSDVLLVGSTTAEVEILRLGLDAELIDVPALALASARNGTGTPWEELGSWPWAAELDAWRTDACWGAGHRRVVVAPWDEEVPLAVALDDLGAEGWVARHELPFARWFAAMGVAARRCVDGGAIVAVIERPAPLDCAGRAAETGLGDAIESMVRSMARAEGHRNVRVNAVTTPTRLRPANVVDPAPSLARYPGTVDADVLGAVRLLLAEDALGITGTVLDADDGRSWR